MYNEVISLSKFLSRYALVQGENLSKVKHEEVKVLFPYLKRSSFDEIKKDKSLLYSGKVVLVSDGKKTIPYYVPVLEISMEEEYDEFNRDAIPSRKINDEVYDYASLSEYELRSLLKRRFNSRRNQKEARRELLNRGISLKKTWKE